jgi:ankyrin repeat protein
MTVVLPNEIINKILLFTDISTCIEYNSLYCSKKHYKQSDWNHFIAIESIDSLKYLYDNSLGKPDYTALLDAIEYGNIEILQFLIDIGEGSELALEFAIEVGSLVAVKMLVNSGVINPCGAEDAITYDNIEIFEFLLNSGFNLGSSMYIACSGGCLKAVEMMINIGEVVPEFALSDAISNGYLDVVKYLIEVAGETPNQEAVEDSIISKNIDLMIYLTDLKLPLGNSLLYSIDDNDTELVYFFIKQGSSISKECMISAINNGSFHIVNILAVAGLEILEEYIRLSEEIELYEISEYLSYMRQIQLQ